MENVLRLLSTSKAFDGRWGISRVSGPTRYFLARLLLEYGAAPIRCRQPDFEGKWLVTAQVVGNALAQLENERILRSKPESRQGRGRPRTQRWLEGKFLDELGQQKPGPGSPHFAGLIEHILTSDFPNPNHKAKARRRSKLTPYNRLLLGVLLAHADSRGVVANLGITHLRRLAGLSQDQLTSQMSRLAELGYLRGRVPGVSGKRIFGRVTGLMYLNVGHPDFESLGRLQWVVMTDHPENEPLWSVDLLCKLAHPLALKEEKVRRQSAPEPEEGPRADVRRHGREIFRRETEEFERQWTVERFNLLRPRSFRVSTLGELHKFFLGGVSPETRYLLQAHVNELASRMLAADESFSEFMAFRGKAEFAFLTELLGTFNEDVAEPCRLASAVFVMAYYLHQFASKVLQALIVEDHIDKATVKSSEFVILPVNNHQGYGFPLSLIILPESEFGSKSDGAWRLKPGAGGKLNIEAFGHEFDLDEKEREGFGLRGKSKQYPGKQQG